MNHEQAEREAVIYFWIRYPECKSPHVTMMNSASGKQFWRGNPNVSEAAVKLAWQEVTAHARDAIIEWLLPRVKQIRMFPFGSKSDDPTVLYVTTGLLDERQSFVAPTRLLALIAAARAVAGGEK